MCGALCFPCDFPSDTLHDITLVIALVITHQACSAFLPTHVFYGCPSHCYLMSLCTFMYFYVSPFPILNHYTLNEMEGLAGLAPATNSLTKSRSTLELQTHEMVVPDGNFTLAFTWSRESLLSAPTQLYTSSFPRHTAPFVRGVRFTLQNRKLGQGFYLAFILRSYQIAPK